MTSKTRGITVSWATIEVGQEVDLFEGGRHRFAGRVDAVGHEHDVIWVTSPTGERRLFHVDDGFMPAQAPA